MITLTYSVNEDLKEVTNVNEIVVKSEEEGHIDDYLNAFETLLLAVGFQPETINEALTFKNPR